MKKSIAEWGALLRSHALSAEELTKEYLKEIEEKDEKIHSFLLVAKEEALMFARALDRLPEDEKFTNPLWGIPYGAKDNLCTKNLETTCASGMLKGYMPPYDATVIEKLKKRGAVLLGKLNMDEFAMGSTTEYSAYQVTLNPLDSTRVPGGSSGGSAAAVGAGLLPFALGTDTGGSIRQPASFCSVTGIKPTYGCVSRYGNISFASSFDQIGPLTSTVLENSTVLSALKGKDRKDATSLETYDTEPVPRKDLKGLSFGILKELTENISEDAQKALKTAVDVIEKLGGTVTECSVPSVKSALEAYYVLSSVEMSSNLGRFDGVRYGNKEPGSASSVNEFFRQNRNAFGMEVKKRMLFGTALLSCKADQGIYEGAQMVRNRQIMECTAQFQTTDLLLMPGASSVAYRLQSHPEEDGLQKFKKDYSTISANLTGLPALCIPTCRSKDRLSVGIQLMGNYRSESLIYSAGALLEEAMK